MRKFSTLYLFLLLLWSVPLVGKEKETLSTKIKHFFGLATHRSLQKENSTAKSGNAEPMKKKASEKADDLIKKSEKKIKRDKFIEEKAIAYSGTGVMIGFFLPIFIAVTLHLYAYFMATLSQQAAQTIPNAQPFPKLLFFGLLFVSTVIGGVLGDLIGKLHAYKALLKLEDEAPL